MPRLEMRKSLDAAPLVAPTVLGMSTDPTDLLDAGTVNGKLMATRLALWEAISRLDEDARAELHEAFTGMLDQIGSVWPSPLTAQQSEVFDELELIAHQMRYHPAHTAGQGPPSGDYAVVCMKCDTFPLELGQNCPTCGTTQFLSVLRI